MLLALAGIKQSPVHHPEGDVWARTMLVVDNAAREKKAKDPRADVGCTAARYWQAGHNARVRRGRITAYGHDKEGGTLAARFLFCLSDRIRIFLQTSPRWYAGICSRCSRQKTAFL